MTSEHSEGGSLAAKVVGVGVVGLLSLPLILIVMVAGVELVLGKKVNMPRRGFLDTLPEEIREGMWTEFLDVTNGDRGRYRTNVHWIGGPFEGTYYNVDEDGVRRTVQAGEPGPRVFMFGGSSLWGFHSPDAETIPSLVAAELARLGVPAEVVNHGQIGYVSTQEALYLAQLVADGDTPAAAVFLDGLNEIDVPRLLSNVGKRAPAEVPGLHFADSDFREEREYRRSAWLALKYSLARFRVIESLGLIEEVLPPTGQPWTEADEAKMVSLVSRGYAANVAMVEGLAQANDFAPLFYWQPTVSSKKTLTDHESPPRFIGAQDGEHFGVISDAVRGLLDEDPHFKDISAVLDDMTGTAYTDSRHYTLPAKKIIAARIAADLAPILRPAEAGEPADAPTDEAPTEREPEVDAPSEL